MSLSRVDTCWWYDWDLNPGVWPFPLGGPNSPHGRPGRPLGRRGDGPFAGSRGKQGPGGSFHAVLASPGRVEKC